MTEWTMSAWAMLRRAGFPFDLLSPMCDEEFADQLRKAAVDGDWTGPAARFDDVLRAAVRELVRAGSNDRVLEAVYLSSPEAYQRLHDWVREEHTDSAPLNHRAKRRVQLLTMYLQRLCTKNETASFFGPLAWVRTGAADQTFAFADPGELRNRVSWSNWAVQQLADLICADPQVWPALTPRATPWLLDTGDGACHVDFTKAPPGLTPVPELATEPLRGLRELCDGTRTVGQIARLRGVPPELLRAELAELAGHDAVHIGFTIPSGAPDPFAVLRDQVATLPDGPRETWLALLSDLDGHRARIEGADGLTERIAAVEALNERYRATGAGDTARKGGKMASDRTLWFEDCRQDWGTALLAEPAADSLRTDFPVLLEALFQLPLARLRAHRAACHEWFTERFPPGSTQTLATALGVAAETELAELLRAVDDKQRASGSAVISDVLYANSHVSTVELPMSWARDAIAGQRFDAWALCSADLHLSARDDDAVRAGEFSWVLGEVHALHEVLAGPFALLHPEPESLFADCDAHRRGLSDAVICEPVKPHKGKMSVRVPTGGPQIEFAALSGGPEQLRLAPGELTIRDLGDRLGLFARRHGEIELAVTPQVALAKEAFSLLRCFTGVRAYQMVDFLRETVVDHLPRLRIGRFVLGRETWWLEPMPARRTIFHFDNQRLAWRIKHEHGLPDRVFVRFAEEPKPIFVDFRNPLLVEMFVKGMQSSEHRVRVTEMLPAPGNMWLDHGLGEHTNEFRIGFYRSADS